MAVAIACLVTANALADELVNRADANGDGFVSLYELRAAHYADPEFNQRIERSFERLDSDGDGMISAQERQAVRGEAGARTTVAPAAGSPAARSEAREVPVAREARPQLPRKPTPAPARRDTGAASGSAAWIEEIDADNSGRASMAELVASGGGTQWFGTDAFHAADTDGDGELDAGELDALVRSVERRHR